MPVMSDEQIAALTSKCWQKRNHVIAVAVTLAESSGNTDSENSCCVGLMQINTLAHPKYTRAAMKNPVANVEAACQIFHEAGGWHPWESFTIGAYLRYLPRAEKAVREWQKGDPGGNAESLLEPFGGAHSEGAAEATVKGAANAAKAALSWTTELGKVLHFLGDSSGWLRVGKVAIGGVLLIIAIDELTKIGPTPASNIKPRVGAATSAVITKNPLEIL